MSFLVFQDVPQVELLQWLARGSLKQNLLRAIRLWVWLRSLYGENSERVILDDCFSYADWRNAFFSPTHPKGEEIPSKHDSHCLCAKTTAEWLFNEKTGIVPSQWQKSMLAHTGIDASALEKLLQQPLFGVTRRSLQSDLETLAKLGWLIYKNQKYYRVSEFPPRPVTLTNETNSSKLSAYELNFLHPDLVEIVQNHSQKINGIQRFFLQLDYVIPSSTIDLVSNWQYELRQLWSKTPVPPIKLTYNSAKIGKFVTCVVYPVCIYYMQRAVYLCAYGESPDRKSNWYNFRLDRIQDITTLEWNNAQIPQNLQQHYPKFSCLSPDYIAQEMSNAWGFDFYLPSSLMLLRFDRDYNERYIQNTIRHETFKAITYQQAQSLICHEVTQLQHQESLLKILVNRSPQDAYYQVYYRHSDNGIMMRLRAWRPKCEVIFPYELRQSIAADVFKELQLYKQN
ncbi:TIGR03985 family CRISPR-associated protein [Nostoc sp. CENA67]|uniref:TIGR03985 family CRISPR-associated protein n=1 Tax=Amazonocrinis nigriterrae CENA67 TaxID=2794033 RepID=A0A8J7HPM6_9NOST|nr:TIGR03985 family CRISPR-associated protein [Amazonocrinis nigriterrae]MBH8561140.1 TIGR03985 family CRISPR-associated protein [Amazonocrinis nigriterrae CENA67]